MADVTSSVQESSPPAPPSALRSEDDPLRTDRMICIGLALLVLLVFKQTLSFEFVNFDDDAYVYENPEVAAGLTWHGLGTAFAQGSRANWDPLTTISHMLDCQLFGLRPGGHHLTNLLLHTVTVVLLFRLLLTMTGARWRSAFAAALFAIHPLRVESVAWVTERKDVLSGLFFVLTIAAYVRFVRNGGRWHYLLIVACYALGLMSKAMLITAPFVLLLLDYWPLQRFEKARGNRQATRRLLLEKAPLLAMALIACVMALHAQSEVNAVQSLGRFPIPLRFANALNSIVIYLRQLFFPARLAVYYPYPAQGLPIAVIMAAALIICAISALAWRWRRQRPYLLTGWLWYLVMLVPVIGLLQLGQQSHADRYTYLPMIGICVSLSWLAAEVCSILHLGRLAGAAAAAILLALAAGTVKQVAYWQNSLQLWERCLAVTSRNALAEYNYGLALVQAGRPADAVPAFAAAAEINPGDFSARRNLGSALFQTGRYPEAITEFRTALQIDPSNAPAHVGLGNALYQTKLTNEALSEYKTALKIDPEFADAENTLGYALLKSGRTDEAITHLEHAVKLQPEHVNARFNLGNAYLQMARTNEAVRQLEAALRIQPDYAPALLSLNGVAWRMATSPLPADRNGDAAVEIAYGLVQLTQASQPVFLGTLSAAYAETGKFPEAASAAKEALQQAQAAGNTKLVEQFQMQLSSYGAGQPFRSRTGPAEGGQ